MVKDIPTLPMPDPTPLVPGDWRAVRCGNVADGRTLWDVFPVRSIHSGGWLVPHYSEIDRWVPCRRVSEDYYYEHLQHRADILRAWDIGRLLSGDGWEDYCDEGPWGLPLTLQDAVALLITGPAHFPVKLARTDPEEDPRG